jgi:hypothetical protein
VGGGIHCLWVFGNSARSASRESAIRLTDFGIVSRRTFYVGEAAAVSKRRSDSHSSICHTKMLSWFEAAISFAHLGVPRLEHKTIFRQ